eukprot:UN30398
MFVNPLGLDNFENIISYALLEHFAHLKEKHNCKVICITHAKGLKYRNCMKQLTYDVPYDYVIYDNTLSFTKKNKYEWSYKYPTKLNNPIQSKLLQDLLFIWNSYYDPKGGITIDKLNKYDYLAERPRHPIFQDYKHQKLKSISEENALKVF